MNAMRPREPQNGGIRGSGKDSPLKNRLLIRLLAAMLLCSVSGCHSNPPPHVGGEESTAPALTEEITDGTSGDMTLPDSEGTAESSPIPPHEALVSAALESLLLNDEDCFPDGSVADGLAARDYSFTMEEGAELFSLMLIGWAGFDRAVDSFGYRLDEEEAVFGNFALSTEEELRDQGGSYAQRFAVTAPLFALSPGTHTVTFLARLSDGSVAELCRPITLILKGLTADLTVPYHSSLTHLNGKGPGGNASYTNRGGNSDRGVDVIDGKDDQITVADDGTLTVSGWLALEGGVDHYAWTVDGVTWYAITDNGTDGEPSPGHFAELGFANATEKAILRDLVLDLSPCNGRTVSVTVGGVPKNTPERVVPFIRIIDLFVPDQPEDIAYSFTAEARNNPEGTELHLSDLQDFFTANYGAGDQRHVVNTSGELCYLYGGIHALQTAMDGRYAMTAAVQKMSGTSFFFVRGTQIVRSVDEVPIPLMNYFETDGAGLCGGAGIYAQLSAEGLTVVIKGLEPNTAYRVRNYVYEYPVTGDTLTLADDGNTVYVLVDGKEITRIELTGTAEYPEHLALVSPTVQFAASATITMADGRQVTVRNTLVAASCNAGCGVAIRGGEICFTRLDVVPFSQIGIEPD